MVVMEAVKDVLIIEYPSIMSDADCEKVRARVEAQFQAGQAPVVLVFSGGARATIVKRSAGS